MAYNPLRRAPVPTSEAVLSRSGPVVAVVGATGLVGREFLQILEERQFPASEVRLYASGRSAGETLVFRGRDLIVQNLAHADFDGVDLVLSSPGAAVSREFAPKAVAAGAVVVDNSSAFRMEPDVPLVVPEVNPEAVRWHRGIIANPNCSTIQLVVVLWPIHQAFGLERVVVSTYQAVSGAGRKAMEELLSQCVALLNQRPLRIEKFPHQIAFNVLPHIDVFEEDGSTREEVKVVRESRKIMGLPNLRIVATAVRVPVMNGHSESVNIELARPATPEDVREVLSKAPGLVVHDDPSEAAYPMPLLASGRDEVFVGRIRRDPSVENGIALWISADNLRKGAALNAIQIAELLDWGG